MFALKLCVAKKKKKILTQLNSVNAALPPLTEVEFLNTF